MSIVVVGSVALDTIETACGKATDVLGGSATYFSLGARLFAPVNLVAVVGQDFPARHVALLRRKKINLKGLEVSPGQTFRWSGIYGPDFGDAKTLTTALNVFATFNPKVPTSYLKSSHVFLANIDPDLQLKLVTTMRTKSCIILDTMNFWIQNKRMALVRLLKRADIVLLNESEAQLLTGERNLLLCARAIMKLGPKTAVIKRGQYGAVLCDAQKYFSVPALLLDTVVDPTGAGDTFAGGFVGYLASRPRTRNVLKHAVAHGTVMASFAVESFSVKRLAAVSKKDVTQRLRQFAQLTQLP